MYPRLTFPEFFDHLHDEAGIHTVFFEGHVFLDVRLPVPERQLQLLCGGILTFGCLFFPNYANTIFRFTGPFKLSPEIIAASGKMNSILAEGAPFTHPAPATLPSTFTLSFPSPEVCRLQRLPIPLVAYSSP
ncbi:hypothetical protein AAHC03_0869 [Spirometra sp. Aus1]